MKNSPSNSKIPSVKSLSPYINIFIGSQKENYNKEINELLEKSNMEKTAYEEKYDQKRKSTKELEATYQKKISQLEKDKVILCAQLSTLESKKSEYEKRFAVDHESFSNQLNELRESFSNERKALQGEIERYKDKLHQIEHESAEVQSNYERDRALWEGKYNFLEQQRD
jgi:chromosome segregation ATPase